MKRLLYVLCTLACATVAHAAGEPDTLFASYLPRPTAFDIRLSDVTRLVAVRGADGLVHVEATTSAGRTQNVALTEDDWRTFSSAHARTLRISGGARNQDGRGALVLMETAFSLGYYGWVVPEVMDIHETQGQVAAYMLTSAAGFVVPFVATRHATVSAASRSLAFYGATRGFLTGLTVHDATYPKPDSITSDGYTYYFVDSDKSGDNLLGWTAASSVVGTVLGCSAAGWLDHDESRAEVLTTMADLGGAVGAGTAFAADLYDEPNDGSPTPRGRRIGRSAIALGGAGAGIAAGVALGNTGRYTVGDARALRTSYMLGAQLALPVVRVIAGHEDVRARDYVAGALAGSVAGTYAGDRLLRPYNLRGGDGLLLTAAQLAGGLLATGITFLLVDPDRTDSGELIYLTTSSIGSAAATAVAFRALTAHGRAR